MLSTALRVSIIRCSGRRRGRTEIIPNQGNTQVNTYGSPGNDSQQQWMNYSAKKVGEKYGKMPMLNPELEEKTVTLVGPGNTSRVFDGSTSQLLHRTRGRKPLPCLMAYTSSYSLTRNVKLLELWVVGQFESELYTFANQSAFEGYLFCSVNSLMNSSSFVFLTLTIPQTLAFSGESPGGYVINIPSVFSNRE